MKKTTLALIMATTLASSSVFATTTTTTKSVATDNQSTATATSADPLTLAPNKGAGFYIGANTVLFLSTIDAGYMFNPYLGVEGGFTYMIDPIGEAFGGNGEHIPYLAAKTAYHINHSRWSVFGKLGVAQASEEFKDSSDDYNITATGTLAYLAAGVGCDLGNHLTLSLNANGYLAHGTGFGYPALGLEYHF